MNLVTAYQIAGVVVATHHSRFHVMDGVIPLADGLGLDGAMDQFVSGERSPDGIATSDGVIGSAEEERKVLLLAGRQAELIHYTLNAPAHLDAHLEELSRAQSSTMPADPHLARERVSQALALVTGHWHEIECLAAWLTRQNRATVPAKEMVAVLNGILPSDHGLFP